MKKVFLLFLSFVCIVQSFAQEKKTFEAQRIDTPPKIDGILDDAVWQTLPKYGDFYMYQPGNEGTVDAGYESEVQMAYDDKNVYFAAYLYDPNPDAVLSQFSQRDEVFAQADRFVIALNTLNDGINETRFYVTSAGTIGDAIVGQNNFDFGYNVVFECRISKDEKGWYAEFRIPYNALRFPEVDVQNWGINFYRALRTKNETHTWNFIKNGEGRQQQFSGNVTGVSNIDPPIRLTFFPFVQGVVTDFDGNTETDFSAGMDIKYGISDNFTLDATLIPDFGQAAFDQVSLNLGPFEQTFSENRQFFTEGIDLFNRGRIFFSRRIGNAPTGSVGELGANEVVDEFPSKVNLLNAVKISGRTKGKLGIGFFNAVTERTFAKIRDTETGATRKVEVEPLANYNIVVFDQQFWGNSSVSVINTNVTRNGSFRDANTTGLVFDIADKGNNFRGSGRAIFSNVIDTDGVTSGFLSELDIFRIKGNLRYRVGHDFSNTTFNINDLGLNFRNNFNNFVAGVWYQIFEPTETFNNYRVGFTVRHRRLYKPSVQTGNNFNADAFFVNKEQFAFGGNASVNSKNEDYFEPRMEGRFVTYDANFGGNAWLSSDYRKKFAVDATLGHRIWFDEEDQKNYFVQFSPRYRFSDKFLVIFNSNLFIRDNNFGYVGDDGVDVFLGQRDVTNLENTLTASLNLDPYKAIDLRFRNSWSTADYSENIFWVLNDDGSRTRIDYDTSENDPNRNFNIWNLDLSFRWRFAPGSEATLLYRNQIFNLDNESTLSYGQSLSNLFDQPMQNTVSLRITYFVDYNNIKGIFKRRNRNTDNVGFMNTRFSPFGGDYSAIREARSRTFDEPSL